MTPEPVRSVSRGNPWFRRDAGGTNDDDAPDPWAPDKAPSRRRRPGEADRTTDPKLPAAEPKPAAGLNRPDDSRRPDTSNLFAPAQVPADDPIIGDHPLGDGRGDRSVNEVPFAQETREGTSSAFAIPATALDIVGRGNIGEISLDAVALRESMQLAQPILDSVASMFYANVFWQRPDLREMFPVGMERQRGRLVSALLTIVGSLGDQEDPSDYLRSLGRDHRKFGVVTEHYDVIGAALLNALGALLGEEWTPRRHKAWMEAYDIISRVMIEAADDDAQKAPAWWDAEVVLHHRLGPDMAIIQVRPHTDYPYRPGQYCSLMSPRRDRMWRSYSIANRPRNDNILEFHIRAEAAGWVSSALVWRTEVGDVLRLGAPQGRDITFRGGNRDILLIAGGTGIVPIVGAVQQLAHQFDQRRTHLFYAGREQEQMYALPHLESIGARFGGLALVPVVSSYGSEERRLGLLGNVVLSYGAWLEHDIYVAGPTALVRSIVTTLVDNGVPMERIRHDDYGVSGF
jgi:NAD(P)H-flavin reductase/hemoglobin-like flavoprotein